LVHARAQWVWQKPIPQENHHFGLSFSDANNGTAIGWYGTILRTTDGGRHWISRTSEFLYGISFTDEEMGIRPSYNFEANTVVFVEGIFDEFVFLRWITKLAICHRVALIESGGYSNIQFATNAKILRKKAVRVNVFAVVDGDSRRKGDYSQVKAALGIPEKQILELDAENLEAVLAVPGQF
jgi:hypothetical protein